MRPAAITRLERNVKRGGEIVGVLAKYGLADWGRCTRTFCARFGMLP